MTKVKVLICPYCGETQPAAAAAERCRSCGGLFEPLSRQATHNEMGPWFFRDEQRPFQPGCSYETLVKLIERGQVNRYTIVRGPTTKQFWTVARRAPGIAHLLGYCHSCDASVDASDHGCHACGVPFGAYLDRNFLGLPDIRPLPWEAGPEDDLDRTGPSSRMMDFRRAAEPLGISSFASDEELRGGSGSQPALVGSALSPHAGGGAGLGWAVTATGQPLTKAATTQATQIVRQPQDAAALLEASPAGLAARSMQRRLVRQQQTIRLLVLGLIAVTVLMSLVVAAIVARGSRGGSAMQPNGSQSAAAPEDNDGANQPAESPPDGAGADQPLESPPAAITPDEQHAQFVRAMELLTEARKPYRLQADRIRDYESALVMLRALAAVPQAQRVANNVPEQLAAAEQELERLRLEELFP